MIRRHWQRRRPISSQATIAVAAAVGSKGGRACDCRCSTELRLGRPGRGAEPQHHECNLSLLGIAVWRRGGREAGRSRSRIASGPLGCLEVSLG